MSYITKTDFEEKILKIITKMTYKIGGIPVSPDGVL